MARFLHVADVHLGFDRYDTPQRTLDFFYAFQDALERYAIAPQVDFVLIAGDLFEHRNLLPATLNQAQVCLSMLQEAGIPVLAIEGNHDYRPYGTKSSWLRYLADWDLLMLLEPSDNLEQLLEPWNSETKQGGYIDLDCGVRVIGSQWYGAAAPQAIAQLAAEITALPAGPKHTVMMFHHGLEGQIARYSGALRYQDLLPLRQAGVDYLALGHIHRQYSVEDWVFNPGSIEANTVTENQEQNPRGVYLVTLDHQGITAQHHRDYQQRPILRLTVTATKQQTVQELEAATIAAVKNQPDTAEAIVEVRLIGQVSFDRFELDLRSLRQQLQELTGALILLLRYDVTSTLYETTVPGQQQEIPDRQEIEQYVFTDLLAGYGQYREQAADFAKGLMDLKDQVINHTAEADLYRLAEQLCEPVLQGKSAGGSAT